MSKILVAHDIVASYDGIVRTSDFNDNGIRNDELSRFCTSGKLYRVRKGVYSAVPTNEIAEEQLLAELLPDAVICMESALYYYGYSDHAPTEWTISVPRSFSRSRLKIDGLFLKPRYVQEELFDLGLSTENINGFELKIYDRERCVCDCFKYRNKIDSELFNKALNAYASDPQKNLMKLLDYARKMRVQKKVREIMEVLLNG